MCGRHGPPGVAPTLGHRIEVQRGLRLRAGQADLPRAGDVPGCWVCTQHTDALSDLVFVDGLDAADAREQCLDPVWRGERDRARAVLADVAQKGERVAG